MLSEPKLREFPVQHEAVESITCSVQELPERLGRIYGEVAQWATRRGVHVSRPFARYTAFTADSCTLEAGFVVDRAVADNDGQVQQKDDGGYTAFTALHTGPYAWLGQAYDAMKEHIRIHGYVPAGAPLEYYLTPPDTPPQEQKTEIVWPVLVNEV